MPEVTLAAELVFWLILLFPVPILLLALIRPAGRLVFFAAGLVFMFAANDLVTPSGPDNPMLVLPVIGLIVAADAAFAELILRCVRLVRSRRAPRPD